MKMFAVSDDRTEVTLDRDDATGEYIAGYNRGTLSGVIWFPKGQLADALRWLAHQVEHPHRCETLRLAA